MTPNLITDLAAEALVLALVHRKNVDSELFKAMVHVTQVFTAEAVQQQAVPQ